MGVALNNGTVVPFSSEAAINTRKASNVSDLVCWKATRATATWQYKPVCQLEHGILEHNAAFHGMT